MPSAVPSARTLLVVGARGVASAPSIGSDTHRPATCGRATADVSRSAHRSATGLGRSRGAAGEPIHKTQMLGCPQDPKENSFPTQKGTHEANLMLSVPNRSEASSVGGPTNRQKGFAIVTRSSASVTLHLAPSGRGSDLVQADPRWEHRSGPLALGVEQARPPPPPHRRAPEL